MYLSSGRGTAIIERVVAGIAIRRASGTTDPDLFAKIQAMLDEIDEAGREDLARMLADGQIKAAVLLHTFRRQGLSLKLSPERALPLKAAIETWLTKAERKGDLAPKTVKEYGYLLDALLQGNTGATAADLPAMLGRRRTRAKPRTFNLTRTACQAFLRDTVADGRYSELWAQVSRVRTLRVKRKPTSGLPPDIARALAEQLGRLGMMWWSLCGTGMGNKEYWETPWEVEDGRILIHGTKRDARDRVIPRIVTPIRPLCHQLTFGVALRAAAAEMKLKGVTIYTGRRTWAHWLELAKIPPSRQDAYMGHGPKGVAGLYRQHEVAPYLAADREALQAVVGADPAMLKVVG